MNPDGPLLDSIKNINFMIFLRKENRLKPASLRTRAQQKAGITVPGEMVPLDPLHLKFAGKVPDDLSGLIETGSLEARRGWYQARAERALLRLKAFLRSSR